ncbi:glutamate receptor ionotropic, delta-2-like [Penaeus japonicus]|uniref:glutamate receptor ionotropic, delta-2-like n=1 Tax=Penaeus japonicus TaxID=27405 RepID=UPI001C70DB31|nr:glutamate receptor ionotropic, delta-2-like [Penaeus japonicus]
MYSGTLTAVLAVPSFEKPIDSLHDLAAAHDNGFVIGTTRESSFEEVFKSASSGIYREVWELFDHEDRPKSFLPSPGSGIRKVLEDKFVFINAELNSKLKATQLGFHEFYIARETFMPQGYGIACSSGSPLRDIFSKALTSMTEAGLVYKWAKDEVATVAQKSATSSEKGPIAINLQHLQAAFFLVVLGYGLATIALIGEIILVKLCNTNAKMTVLQM